MDFHCLKRRRLQKLCKKHEIPANSSNLEMANKLAELTKERENPAIEAADVEEEEEKEMECEEGEVLNKKGKKVRFSPEQEMIEFTRSQELKRRSKRNTGK